MKKLTMALIAGLFCVAGAMAQEAAQVQPKELRYEEQRTISPVCFSVQGDDTIDIIGLRLSVWGHCQNLTGVDLSIGGEAVNAYGLQLALVRNKVTDRAGALQIALGANKAVQLTGMQIGLWNETVAAKGVQLGFINTSHDVRGVQIGLINNTDMIYGYQIGLINVIRGGAVPFLPIINTTLSAD